MKKIIILLLLITVIIPNAFGQEGITLTKDNKAYYRLTVSGNRSHDNGPLGVDCDYGIKEIRFLDKNNKTVKTIDADGKHGVFSYDTENQQFTKNQFPVKIHIDND
ncbi:hypothetical protein J9332_38565, partial [Aquimarina celericrescens]|nr:hypothetical protein [Aquimarina celericrescens]